MTNKELMLQQCDEIKNPNIKAFTELAITNLPDYCFTTPASTSGKYHPSYALGEGGLVRHILAAVRIAHHLFHLEQFQNQFTSDERDMVIAALLLHDGWKHGNKNSPHTVFEHPVVCAEWIQSDKLFDNIIAQNYRVRIADCVATHMGEWNTTKRSSIVLEKPNSDMQKFVHMCDYLASRKDIEVLFNELGTSETPQPKIEDFIIPFGKYKGRLLIEIVKLDRNYLEWLAANAEIRSPMKEFMDELGISDISKDNWKWS